MGLQKTDFFLYNILNFEEPQIVFMYGAGLIIFLFIASKLNFSLSLLISLIFYTIIVYYFYTYRNQNYLYETEKNNEKFQNINTNSNQLKNFPKIVDLLYFFEDFKKYNIDEYKQIVNLLTQFSTMYDSCKTDYNLIDSLFSNMLYIRIKILYKMNSFIFNTYGTQYSNIIIDTKDKTKLILSEMLDELVLLHKKKIYYNGYNINTSVLDTSSIRPYNILQNNNPVSRNNTPIITDLLVW
jgi:hypothetical protein